MCIVSMVIDRFDPLLPSPTTPVYPQPTPPGAMPPGYTWPWQPQVDLSDLRKLVDDFKEALAAARTVDRLTGQPDCEDPEKAKLLDRVALLESQLEVYRLREENASLREELRRHSARLDEQKGPGK